MLYIEAALLPGGSGQIILTGQLGAVMQESARAALSHIRQNANCARHPDRVPQQAGSPHPRAGRAPSRRTDRRPASRWRRRSSRRRAASPVNSDVAMTGEITLSGLVLPVGGIREKALAARRHGIKTIHPAADERTGSGRAAARSAQRDDVRAGAHARRRPQGRAAARRPDDRVGGRLPSTSPGMASATPRGRSRSSTRSGAASPATPILIRTSAPRWLFDRTLRVPAQLLPGECDTGVVQLDSLHLDATETIRARRGVPPHAARARARAKRRCCASTASRWSSRTRRRWRVPRPPRPAFPSVVVSNFTWDWIYEGYGAELPRRRTSIARCATPTRWRRAAGACRCTADSRPSHRSSTCRSWRGTPGGAAPRCAALCGLPADRPVALLSFGGYGVRDIDLARLDCLDAGSCW